MRYKPKRTHPWKPAQNRVKAQLKAMDEFYRSGDALEQGELQRLPQSRAGSDAQGDGRKAKAGGKR